MQLTQQDKADLRLLLDHKGFRVLEAIIKEQELNVLQNFKTVDLTKAEHVSILSKNQWYLKGINDLLTTLKTQSNEIVNRDFKD